jgi:hypothetical protein
MRAQTFLALLLMPDLPGEGSLHVLGGRTGDFGREEEVTEQSGSNSEASREARKALSARTLRERTEELSGKGTGELPGEGTKVSSEADRRI